MQEYLQLFNAPSLQPTEGTPLIETVWLFLHSIVIGCILMALTAWVNVHNGPVPESSSSSPPVTPRKKTADGDLIPTASSVLFLCVGMTAVMILVNDNLARAFAIGAAIALVRFRIKMTGKFIGMGLFYSVLTGMACGVRRPDIAWEVTVIFALILMSVLAIRRILRKNQ